MKLPLLAYIVIWVVEIFRLLIVLLLSSLLNVASVFVPMVDFGVSCCVKCCSSVYLSVEEGEGILRRKRLHELLLMFCGALCSDRAIAFW